MKLSLWTFVLATAFLQLNGLPRKHRFRRWIPERLSNSDYGVGTDYTGSLSSYDSSMVPSRQSNYLSWYFPEYLSGNGDVNPGDFSGMMFRAKEQPTTNTYQNYDPVQQLYRVQQYSYLQTLQQSPYYSGPSTVDNYDYNVEYSPGGPQTAGEEIDVQYAGRANMQPAMQREPMQVSRVPYPGASYAPTSYPYPNQYLRMPPTSGATQQYAAYPSTSTYQAPKQQQYQEKPSAQSRSTDDVEEAQPQDASDVKANPAQTEEKAMVAEAVETGQVMESNAQDENNAQKAEETVVKAAAVDKAMAQESEVEATAQEENIQAAEIVEDVLEDRAHHERPMNYSLRPAPTVPAEDSGLSSPLDLVYPGTSSSATSGPPQYYPPPQPRYVSVQPQSQYVNAPPPPQYTQPPAAPPSQNQYYNMPPPQQYQQPYNPIVNYGDTTHYSNLQPVNTGYDYGYNYNYNNYQGPPQYQYQAYPTSYSSSTPYNPYSNVVMAPRITRSQPNHQQRPVTVTQNPPRYQRTIRG